MHRILSALLCVGVEPDDFQLQLFYDSISSGKIYIKIHIFSAPPVFPLTFPSLLFHHFIHPSSKLLGSDV